MKILLDWFKKDSQAMENNVTRIIAFPTKENLKHLGYAMREELDTKKNLIQCYYESDTGCALKMRVVRGEGIDSTVAELLLKNNGMLFVGK